MTQFDLTERIVSVDNLRAMCARVSGMCHRFAVEKVSRSRVHVTYSNPDEYGNAQPITAIFPCYPSTFDGSDNPAVVLDALRVIDPGDTWAGEAWQAFEPLMSCPMLWRSPDQHADDCPHAHEAFAPRIDGACWKPGSVNRCVAGTWQSHGDCLRDPDHSSTHVDDAETCASAHGRHCDAPARAALALCIVTRELMNVCSSNPI